MWLTANIDWCFLNCVISHKKLSMYSVKIRDFTSKQALMLSTEVLGLGTRRQNVKTLCASCGNGEEKRGKMERQANSDGVAFSC